MNTDKTNNVQLVPDMNIFQDVSLDPLWIGAGVITILGLLLLYRIAKNWSASRRQQN